jgi:hypothetical protein
MILDKLARVGLIDRRGQVKNPWRAPTRFPAQRSSKERGEFAELLHSASFASSALVSPEKKATRRVAW